MVAGPGTGEGRRRRIEIVHESLLTKWPRLVRWQAQDVEGAQLRDELRQAAELWDQHGRAGDYLWSGVAFRDFQHWREHYLGGLSEVEEAFAQAMIGAARRRRHRIRIVVAAAFVFLLAVVTVIGYYWRESEMARERAQTETSIAESERRRAEASKLLALAQLEVEDFPTAALAYATKSLQIADSREARIFVSRVLQEAPPVRFLIPGNDSGSIFIVAFSEDMEWLATSGYGEVDLWRRSGGEGARVMTGGGMDVASLHSPRNDRLVTIQKGQIKSVSVPSMTELWSSQIPTPGSSHFVSQRKPLSTRTFREGGWDLHEWSSSGEPRLLRRIEFPRIDMLGDWIVYERDRQSLVRESLASGDDRRVFTGPSAEITDFALHPDGERVAILDSDGNVGVWNSSSSDSDAEVVYHGIGRGLRLRYDARGRWLAAGGVPDGRPTVRLKDTTLPPEARPLTLRVNNDVWLSRVEFSPDGRWLVTTNAGRAAFWPLPRMLPAILDAHDGKVHSLVFSSDGDTLYSASGDGTVRAWDIPLTSSVSQRVLYSGSLASFPSLDLSPTGDLLAVSGSEGTVLLIPTNGGPPRVLSGFSPSSSVSAVSFDPSGRNIAAGVVTGPPADKGIRLWDLETGDRRMISLQESAGDGWAGGIKVLDHLPDGRLLVFVVRGSAQGLPELVLLGGGSKSKEVLMRSENPVTVRGQFSLIGNDGAIATFAEGSGEGAGREVLRFDFRTGKGTAVSNFGIDHHTAVATDGTGRILATGAGDGTVRVGRIDGPEPHLLLGHENVVRAVAISPDGRWIASAGDDRTIRLWPIPDLAKPPLHALPYEELLAKLSSLTNLRVIEDENASSGYRLDYSPFPGWAEVPEW